MFMKDKLIKFMYGRYGMDRFNQALLGVFLAVAVLDLFIRNRGVSRFLTTWELLLLIYMYYRIFSRNIGKRRAELEKYMILENKVRHFLGGKKYRMDQRKEYHIYSCPNCKQKIRIPRGKGHIRIRCPKCGTEFEKKS